VDSHFRTSQAGVFAAGNLLRGVETADWAALEGRRAARPIARYLENAEWNESRLGVQAEAPLAWVYPNVLSPDVPVERFWFRSNDFRQNVNLQFMQGGRVLYQKRLSRLIANTSLSLSGEWMEKVDFTGEPIKLVIPS
jgi:hypothetical protein